MVGEQAWADDLPLPEHLAALRARLVEIRRVLAPHGSLYLHVDWRTVHHVRLLLDEVFGAERFLNELVWAYDYGGRTRDRWPRKHDTILWYAKGDAGSSSGTPSTGSRTWHPGWSARRRRPAASCPRTSGG